MVCKCSLRMTVQLGAPITRFAAHLGMQIEISAYFQSSPHAQNALHFTKHCCICYLVKRLETPLQWAGNLENCVSSLLVAPKELHVIWLIGLRKGKEELQMPVFAIIISSDHCQSPWSFPQQALLGLKLKMAACFYNDSILYFMIFFFPVMKGKAEKRPFLSLLGATRTKCLRWWCLPHEICFLL